MELRDLIKTLPNREDDGIGRGYVGWGPYEDAMTDKGSWRSVLKFDTWDAFFAEFSGCDDDLNIVLDFYFEADFEKGQCRDCGGSGYNPETKQIADDFYDFSGAGRRWCDHITQDEVQALIDRGRLTDFTHTFEPGRSWQRRSDGHVPTADEVNAANRRGSRNAGHDGINRWILIETRAKREGVWGWCSVCEGEGVTRLSDDRLELNLWLAHPRKGSTRGVHIKNVEPDDLPIVKAYLRRSWRKHEQHFKWALSEQ